MEALGVGFFEDGFGDVGQDEHDEGPFAGDVEGVLFSGDGGGDGFGDGVDVGEFFAAGHGGGHRGAGGTGLDGEHGDAFAVDAVAQSA